MQLNIRVYGRWKNAMQQCVEIATNAIKEVDMHAQVELCTNTMRLCVITLTNTSRVGKLQVKD